MNTTDLTAISPLLTLSIGVVAIMLQAAFWRRHGLAVGLTASTLGVTLILLFRAAEAVPAHVTRLVLMDRFALFYIGLFCMAALAVTFIAYGYWRERSCWREEFYVLLLTATLGAAGLVASSHFVSFFLALELLSVSLFALLGYPVTRRHPLEAALKYLVLSGMSSALLLFGISLLYFDSGTFGFAALEPATPSVIARPIMLAGEALVMAALSFKLSLVPFHLWVSDVYEGAPAPAVAFLATVSKGAVAAILLRYLAQANAYAHPSILGGIEAMAILSIIVGNLLALLQGNLKRVLAYSSIAHFGYLLVAFIVGGPFGTEAAAYYLAGYFIMTLGAFGVVARLSPRDSQSDAAEIDEYRGLFWRRPWLAGALSVMLLSLAGIPVTVGFVAKFYLFVAGIEGARWLLVGALVVGSIIGLFYYLRVVATLFAGFAEERAKEPLPTGIGAIASGVTLSALALILLWLGIYPQPAIQLVHLTAGLP